MPNTGAVSRLCRAVVTNDPDDFAFADSEVDSEDHLLRTVPSLETGYLEDWFAGTAAAGLTWSLETPLLLTI